MLDFMRRQRSALKWVWVILIFIFSVTLVTLYIPFGDLPNVSITNDVASIGHDSISSREFQSAYRNYVDRMRGQLNPEMLRAFRFERQIMDALVTRHVMTEEAKRLGLNVSAAEIERKILENFPLDFGCGDIQTQAFGFFRHHVAGHKRVHDLALETEGTQHFRIKLTPHPIDVISIRALKFAGTDTIVPDRGDVVRNADVRKVAKRDVERHKCYAEDENEDHPDPLQG